MKDFLTKIKTLDYKQFALNHGEKIGIGIVGLTVGVICLFLTSWASDFTGEPRDMEKKADDVADQLRRNVWSEERKKEFPYLLAESELPKVEKDLDLADYEWLVDPSPKLYPRAQPAEECEWLPVAEPLASSDRFPMGMAVAAAEPAAEEESKPKSGRPEKSGGRRGREKEADEGLMLPPTAGMETGAFAGSTEKASGRRVVAVTAGETTMANLELGLDTLREEVTVRATVVPLDQDRSPVRVEQVAASVMRAAPIAHDRFQDALPLIPGAEVAGVIDQIAPDDRWKPGDEVLVAPGYSCGVCIACLSGNDPLCHNDHGIFGESRNGGAAELIAVPIRNLLRKPPALSFLEAAALPLDMLTAWHMLVARAQLRPGETVLVHAGGSGVGSAAIQIAGLWGATVFATAGSAAKAARAKELGAHETILYRDVDFLAEVRRLTGKRGVDVVFEHVGADTFDRSVRSLARGGRLVTCGATTGGDVTLNLRLVFFKLLSILGSTMGSLAELHEIMKHVEAGRLRPVVDRVLPLDQIAEGHRVLEEREAFGKIVLRV